ncbi:prepilin peptidase [Pseudolysinimonas sp.]|uniref:prepilin peptidase n=1 Tax=Pseudolysinimonas sp. TaxID=2680009 RepID=UPI003F7D12F7
MGRIAWQLPLAIALAALGVVAIGPTAAAIPALYLAAVTPELAVVDLREHRLPDRMTLPGVVVGVVAAALHAVVTRTVPWTPLLAAAALASLFFVLALAGGMGLGDVKLVAVIGLASPTLAIAIVAPFAAFVLGGVVSTVVLARRGRGSRIPFGPFLLAGYVAALVLVVAVQPNAAAAGMAAWMG